MLAASLVMVGISVLCAVLTSLYDWKCPGDVSENAKQRHPSNSPLSMGWPGKVSIFLLYGATAYSSDIAFEWLASIALTALFVGIVADRGMTVVMTKRGITPADPAPQADARQAAMDHGEAVPEPMGEMLVNIAGIAITLFVWAALFSLVMLMLMSFVEVVVPHYANIMGVVL